MVQDGYAIFTNVTNGGRLTSNEFLFFDGGVNTTSGHIIVNQLFSTRDFTNNGQITVNAGGSLSHSLGNLASGGGSRTTVNAGGIINLLLGSELELNGALLVNDGTINGTTNVNYGSLAKGTGVYGVVNVNTGGVYAPGNSPGISTADAVNFDNTSVTSGAPTLAIELGGTTPGTQYDQLHVTGHLSLGGALAVSLINSYCAASRPGVRHSRLGHSQRHLFRNRIAVSRCALVWNTSLLYTTGVLSVVSPGVPGDYNDNGVVDSADYVLWRKNNNTAITLPNDSTPGTDNSDYDVWRSHFGQTVGSGVGAGAAVPEPTCAVLLLCMSLAILARPHRRP